VSPAQLPTEPNRAHPSFTSDLTRIAAPIALQNLVSALVNMIAMVMVGRLGAASLAAVGLGNQIFFLLTLFLFGVATGGGVFIAQYWGRKDIRGLRRTLGFSLLIGLSVGLLFAIAAFTAPAFIIGLYSRDPEVIALGATYLRIVSGSYLPFALSSVLGLSLRSIERVRLPLVATTLSLVLNVFLSWILIFGEFGLPALGVAGAAWATVIARLLEAGILVTVAVARRAPLIGPVRELLDWGMGWPTRFLTIAWPVILNEVTWSLGITLYNVVFARLGTGAIAAFNVVNTVNQLALVLIIGMANAAAVMIGKKIGEGREDIAFLWARRFAVLAPTIGLAMGFLIVPFGAALPLLYDLDPAVIAEARSMLIVLAATFPFKVFNITLIVGICRAGGDTRFSMFYDLAGVWGLGVPLSALGAFVWGLPAWAVFLLTASDDIAKSFVGVWRLLSKRWIRNVTQ
jgi:putative MATE family efflux protein